MTLKRISKEEVWELLKETYHSEGITKEIFLKEDKIYLSASNSFPLYMISVRICDGFSVNVSYKNGPGCWWEKAHYIPSELLPLYKEVVNSIELNTE